MSVFDLSQYRAGMRGQTCVMTVGRLTAVALLAVALLVLPPLCGTMDVHAAVSDAAQTTLCCANAKSAAADPVDLAAANAPGKTPSALWHFAQRFASKLQAVSKVRAAPAIETRSFYARSSRILR